MFMMEDIKKEMPVIKSRLIEQLNAREQLEQEVLVLKKENYALNEKYTLVQKRYSTIEQEMDQLKQDYGILVETKEDMKRKLNEATEYVIKMEEKVYKSNKISLELLK